MELFESTILQSFQDGSVDFLPSYITYHQNEVIVTLTVGVISFQNTKVTYRDHRQNVNLRIAVPIINDSRIQVTVDGDNIIISDELIMAKFIRNKVRERAYLWINDHFRFNRSSGHTRIKIGNTYYSQSDDRTLISIKHLKYTLSYSRWFDGRMVLDIFDGEAPIKRSNISIVIGTNQYIIRNYRSGSLIECNGRYDGDNIIITSQTGDHSILKSQFQSMINTIAGTRRLMDVLTTSPVPITSQSPSQFRSRSLTRSRSSPVPLQSRSRSRSRVRSSRSHSRSLTRVRSSRNQHSNANKLSDWIDRTTKSYRDFEPRLRSPLPLIYHSQVIDLIRDQHQLIEAMTPITNVTLALHSSLRQISHLNDGNDSD
jgi:hypothetical protein